MDKSRELRTGRHCVFDIHIHLVFLPKYRGKVFTAQILDHLKVIFIEVCEEFESQLIEFEGEADHVHLLVTIPPKVALSKLVNSLKGVSSRLIRKENYPELKRKLWGSAFWSPSYFAGSCGGAPLATIKKYIENQNRPKSLRAREKLSPRGVLLHPPPEGRGFEGHRG